MANPNTRYTALKQLDAGQSVRFETYNYDGLHAAMQWYKVRYGMRFTLRRLGDGSVRVWRIDEPTPAENGA
jgi:hypothetical protein